MFGTAILDTQQRPAAFHLNRTDRIAGLGRRQYTLIGLRHYIGGEIAHVAAIEARTLVDRFFHRHRFEQSAPLQLLQRGIGVGLCLQQDQAGTDFLGLFGEPDLLVIMILDRLVVDIAVDAVLDQHIPQNSVVRGAQAALGRGRFFQPLGHGRLGQQALVDDLFQRARKQVGGHIERLTGTDLALGDRLGADIRGPDSFAIDPRHGDITGFGRRFVADGCLVTGGDA